MDGSIVVQSRAEKTGLEDIFFGASVVSFCICSAMILLNAALTQELFLNATTTLDYQPASSGHDWIF